ncbi:hypothetical protein ACFQMM_17500 [Saliphagus sp. GCM10025308]
MLVRHDVDRLVSVGRGIRFGVDEPGSESAATAGGLTVGRVRRSNLDLDDPGRRLLVQRDVVAGRFRRLRFVPFVLGLQWECCGGASIPL